MPADVSELLAFAKFAKSVNGKVRRQVSKEVANTANELADNARDNAPELTGELKASIQASARGLKGRVEVGARYGEFVEFGTGHGPPQPFMYPAADTADGKFPTDVETAVVRALDGL